MREGECDVNKIKIGILVICILLVLGTHYFNVQQYISLQWFQDNLIVMHHHIAAHYIKSVCAYCVGVMLFVSCALPGTSVLIIIGGMLFGMLGGFLYAFVSVSCGALIVYSGSRYMIGSWIQKRYHKKLIAFNNEMQRYGYYYLFAIRVLAIIPFCVVNICAGLTFIPPRTFFWTLMLGMIPHTLIYAFSGSQLAQGLQVISPFSSSIVGLYISIFLRLIMAPLLIKWFFILKKANTLRLITSYR